MMPQGLTPYYSDDQVALYLGDWRELIPDDFRANLILTDPPYGETSLTWDRWPSIRLATSCSAEFGVS